MASSVDANLATIAEKINFLAQMIAAPANSLPTYGYSDQFARPHIEVDARGYHYVVAERGSETLRHTSHILDEILFDVFQGVTFEMACDYELAHRIEGPDFRRIVFDQQEALLARLSPAWAERRRREHAQILATYPFIDEEEPR
jgi:hypothetical protein